MILEKYKKVFKNFGPAFLILALGIGSGEFILWPYLSANYGFGILWGALLGISLQLFLINIISRNTIIFGKNILNIFSLVFPYIFYWVIFSTIIGFGWPGFSSLTSKLLVYGFSFDEKIFLPLAMFILISSATLLITSKTAYKRILFFEKIVVSFLLFLILFLFIYYFDWNTFIEMLAGFVGIGSNYLFIPDTLNLSLFLATFLGAIAYAGSGGNLLLSNSFYLMNELEEKKEINILEKIKQVFKQNLIFFWLGGIFIISLLSYISYAVLQGSQGISEDFHFLILEANIFSQDISQIIGQLFILLGAFVLFGVQLGVFDFMGRIAKHTKNNSKSLSKKYTDKQAYSFAIISAVIFGLAVFISGMDQPKSLIITGAVINALSMGVMALLLLMVEIKKIPEKFKSLTTILILTFATLFYFLFFAYVVYQNLVF